MFAASATNSGLIKATTGGLIEADTNTANSAGQIELDGGKLQNSYTITGGSITVTGSSNITGGGGFVNNTLTAVPGSTLTGVLSLTNATNSSDSDLSVASSLAVSIIGSFLNNGVLQVESGTEDITTGTFSNPGTVEVDGGTLDITSSVAQLSGSSLTGGTWIVNNAKLVLGTATITMSDADITMSGAASVFTALNTLNSNQGTLSFLSGRAFTTAGDFSNSGTFTIGAGSTLTVSGNFHKVRPGCLLLTSGVRRQVGRSGNSSHPMRPRLPALWRSVLSMALDRPWEKPSRS